MRRGGHKFWRKREITQERNRDERKKARAESAARIESDKKLASIRESTDLEKEMYLAKIKSLQQEAEMRKEEVEIKVEI